MRLPPLLLGNLGRQTFEVVNAVQGSLHMAWESVRLRIRQQTLGLAPPTLRLLTPTLIYPSKQDHDHECGKGLYTDRTRNL